MHCSNSVSIAATMRLSHPVWMKSLQMGYDLALPVGCGRVSQDSQTGTQAFGKRALDVHVSILLGHMACLACCLTESCFAMQEI